MGETSKDVLALLTQLMPGFLTAWVVYGLTTYTKPPQFERVIQALIYSFLVNGVVAILEPTFLLAGRVVQLGIWDKSAELVTSAVVALGLGVLLSYYMRNDGFFRMERALKLTTRTPFPSEWYGAFAVKPRYVVLHLSGDRRLSGYPVEWPTEPSVGHFRMTDAAWINDDNTETVLDGDESILIEAKQVEMVELLKTREEMTRATKTSESSPS
jgi:hypothetical protein